MAELMQETDNPPLFQTLSIQRLVSKIQPSFQTNLTHGLVSSVAQASSKIQPSSQTTLARGLISSVALACEQQTYFFGGREATTGNMSAVRRLWWHRIAGKIQPWQQTNLLQPEVQYRRWRRLAKFSLFGLASVREGRRREFEREIQGTSTRAFRASLAPGIPFPFKRLLRWLNLVFVADSLSDQRDLRSDDQSSNRAETLQKERQRRHGRIVQSRVKITQGQFEI